MRWGSEGGLRDFVSSEDGAHRPVSRHLAIDQFVSDRERGAPTRARENPLGERLID